MKNHVAFVLSTALAFGCGGKSGGGKSPPPVAPDSGAETGTGMGEGSGAAGGGDTGTVTPKLFEVATDIPEGFPRLLIEWSEPRVVDGNFRLHFTSDQTEAQIWIEKHSESKTLSRLLDSFKTGQLIGTPQRRTLSSWTLEFQRKTEERLSLRPSSAWPAFTASLEGIVKSASSLSENDWKDVRAHLALNVRSLTGTQISDTQFASVSSYLLCVGSFLIEDEQLPAFVKANRTLEATCSTARATAFQTLDVSMSDRTYKDTQSAGADLNYLPLDFLARRVCPLTDSLSNAEIDAMVRDLSDAHWVTPRANEGPVSLTNFRPRCLRHFYQSYLPTVLAGFRDRALKVYPTAPEQARAALDAFVIREKTDLVLEDVIADASNRLSSHLFNRAALFPQIFSRLNDLDTKRLTGHEKTAKDIALAIVRPRFEETMFSRYLAALSESDREAALDRLSPVLVSRCKMDLINAECVKNSISDIVVFQVDLKKDDSLKTLGFEVASLSLAPQ